MDSDWLRLHSWQMMNFFLRLASDSCHQLLDPEHLSLHSLFLEKNTACFEVLTQVAQWWETSKTNDCSSFITQLQNLGWQIVRENTTKTNPDTYISPFISASTSKVACLLPTWLLFSSIVAASWISLEKAQNVHQIVHKRALQFPPQPSNKCSKMAA